MLVLSRPVALALPLLFTPVVAFTPAVAVTLPLPLPEPCCPTGPPPNPEKMNPPSPGAAVVPSGGNENETVELPITTAELPSADTGVPEMVIAADWPG